MNFIYFIAFFRLTSFVNIILNVKKEVCSVTIIYFVEPHAKFGKQIARILFKNKRQTTFDARAKEV